MNQPFLLEKFYFYLSSHPISSWRFRKAFPHSKINPRKIKYHSAASNRRYNYCFTSRCGNVSRDIKDVFSIACGEHETLALTRSGKVHSWSYNSVSKCYDYDDSQQCYDYFKNDESDDLGKIVSIACGTNFTICLTESGEVYTSYDLCNNTESWDCVDRYNQYMYNTYEKPEGLNNVVSIACGCAHMVALTESGEVHAWGQNRFCHDENRNLPQSLKNVVAIACGTFHTVALTKSGDVCAWGKNEDGQCHVPKGLKNVVSIACGVRHTVALTESGEVHAWGHNSFGECQVPTGLTNVVLIACGNYHTVALTESGEVHAWGENTHHQCDIPIDLKNVVLIGCGYFHTAALTESGKSHIWGDDSCIYHDKKSKN